MRTPPTMHEHVARRTRSSTTNGKSNPRNKTPAVCLYEEESALAAPHTESTATETERRHRLHTTRANCPVIVLGVGIESMTQRP